VAVVNELELIVIKTLIRIVFTKLVFPLFTIWFF